jgi:hypothetical protein
MTSTDSLVASLNAVAKQLGMPASPLPTHESVVRRLFEDPRIEEKEPRGDLAASVASIIRRCEPGTSEEDLDLFMSDGVPSQFFYELVLNFLESGQALLDDQDEQGEDDSEDDDDTITPVDAHVSQLTVGQLEVMYKEDALEVNPSWQRRDVWSLRAKRELIKSLILGIPLPSIILHEKDSRQFVIDGKQRLLSLLQFLDNQYTLPRYDVPEDNRLYACRGAYFARDGKKSLPPDIRRALNLRELPALMFRDVSERHLRGIFKLYNVAGTKLNAAEIRNAVYQANAVHQSLYVLAGEGDGTRDLGVGGLDVQGRFARALRNAYPGAVRRYQGVDFLARYLGYSRIVTLRGTGPLATPSTSKAIDNYFDSLSDRSRREDPRAVALEIVDVFTRAAEFFGNDLNEGAPFHVRGGNGKRAFSKLAATTHMIGTRFLLALINQAAISHEEALSAGNKIAVPIPDKQQSATIWDYQARLLLALRDNLGVGAEEKAGAEWVEFFHRMEHYKLPPGGEGA